MAPTVQQERQAQLFIWAVDNLHHDHRPIIYWLCDYLAVVNVLGTYIVCEGDLRIVKFPENIMHIYRNDTTGIALVFELPECAPVTNEADDGNQSVCSTAIARRI